MSERNPDRPQQPESQQDEDAIAFAQGLFELARNGGTQMLRPMLDAGVPVDMRTTNGDSLLMLAAGNGHAETVQLLLEKGANPELQNAEGDTALSLARAAGADNVIRHLEP
ncbi:ankyrin repeat domain-containing protein [Marinobacter adhaerens]|uniref:Ankyrin repeat domain-containing protein n=1 Tax=Marinobacter adhaerens TaxID=1033846 RepID=A0A851I1M5_9GAMM|nr:ankyrin repeat domain-containing protein [Marinobacter adhaerens]NWN92018.1 ankyrin repeat domain-containing protein [Marinobacter adhaerens]